MTAYTVAAKRRAKAAQKVLQAACPITGLRLGASKDEPAARKTAQEQVAARDAMLGRRCTALGIADTEKNRPEVAGKEWASLHGRMWVYARVQGISDNGANLDEDAYEGIEAYCALGMAYRRDVLGLDQPRHDDHTRAPLTAEDIRRLADAWVLADGVLTAQGAHARAVVLWCLAAPESVQPRHVTAGDRRALRLAGHQLARHFGVRL